MRKKASRPTWMLISLLLAGACGEPSYVLMTQTEAYRQDALEILPGASAVIPSFGTGWSTIAEDYMGRCISGKSRRLPAFDAAGTLKVTSNLDSHKAQQHMGFATGARAHFAIASGSLKAQAAAAMTQDDYSSVWVFSANYVADAEELDFDEESRMTVIGKAAYGHGAWQRECGDEFVYQIQKGAQLFLVYRLDYQSEAVKNQIDAQLGGRYSLLEVNTELKKLSDFLTRHAQLTIEVYQFGGDPRKITGIITGPNASLTQAEQAARAVIRCGVDNFDACETFLTHALVYATSLESADAFPRQVNAAPSPILYVTMPWTRLGHEVARTPDSYEVAEARLHLSNLFDHVHAAKKRVELLLGSAWSDAAQRELLDPWRLKLNFSLGQINTAVQLCYDDLTVDAATRHLFSAATVARCQDAVRHLQKIVSVPPPQTLRGAVERAISLRAVQEDSADDAPDVAARTMPIGASLCALLPGGAAICGFEAGDNGQTRARAHLVPKRIFEAWQDLPVASQTAFARAPLAEQQKETTYVWQSFAPHGAIYDNGRAPPRLLHGRVLDYHKTYGGVARIGVATEHQQASPDGAGFMAPFARGDLFCSEQTGNCHEMHDAVYIAWQAIGGIKSCLGLPKERVPTGSLTCFTGGSITYDRTDKQSPQINCPARWGRCR